MQWTQASRAARAAVLCVAVLSLASPGGAAEPVPPALGASQPPARIVWLMPQLDTTPASGNAGPGPRRGLADTMADYLTAHWGGRTRHEVVMANIKRGWRMVQSGEPACLLGVLHTADRDAQVWFADTHLIPPHQFVVRGAVMPLVPRNAAGEVDLERVWAEARLHGAIVQGRSYGGELDDMIQRQPPGTMTGYVTPDFGGHLLSMIAIGRADYTLEYDFILADHLATRSDSADLVSLPIQGLADPIVSGVACPRTPWGREVAARVDEVLGTAQARQVLKADLFSHMSPNARSRYGARIDAFFSRPVPPSPFRSRAPSRPSPPPQ